LFQNTSAQDNSIRDILQEELDSFTSLIQISEKLVKEVKKLSIPMLSTMVGYRQEWIEKIQQLEEKRKRMNIAVRPDMPEQTYLKKISKLAEQLVKIDDRIYAGLQNRKLKFVREHAAVAGEAQYNEKQKHSAGSASRAVDITQE